MNNTFCKIFIFFVLTCCLSPENVNQAWAQAICPLDTARPRQVLNLEAFGALPILDEGRVKPIESFARNFLSRISGRERFQKESALRWFARFLFAPRSTFRDKVFLINHPEIAEALGIEPAKNRRYSFFEIQPGYPKLRDLAQMVTGLESKTVVENEILRVFSNVTWYARLSGGLVFAVPHPDFAITDPDVISELQLPSGQTRNSFYDLITGGADFRRIFSEISAVSQDRWTPRQKEYARLIEVIGFWVEHYAGSPLGLIPSPNADDGRWISPMDVIIADVVDPLRGGLVTQTREMAARYWNGEQLEFDLSVRAYASGLQGLLSTEEKNAVQKIPLERLYHRLNFFLWCKWIYGIALLVSALSLFIDMKRARGIVLGSLILGSLCQATGILFRMIILSRPPVTSLYETFVFVSWIGVVCGILLERGNRNWLGNTAGAVCGFVLLFIASRYASEGDTLRMLMAVLNSNFWLSTHVLAITVGYAGCCVSGVAGHVYLIQAIRNSDKDALKRVELTMMGMLGFGLAMTFLGTVLGGIWADQSWGRFWGWDPKENGALMIILWAAIVFHARIAGLIRSVGSAVGCILGLMVVVWAWFGVNLLNVGLHSYGFTSGLAGGLIFYAVCQLTVVLSLVYVLMKRERRP